MRDDRAYLLDMLDAAHKTQRFVEDVNLESFRSADILQSAVIREIQVIGEAARLVSEDIQMAHRDIPWYAIIGMRNRLVHGYSDVRLDVIWRTIHEDIPKLIEQLDGILKDM